MVFIRRYVPISELADSSVLTQTFSGEEPDSMLALEMYNDKMKAFAETRVLWDIALPMQADDHNRIQLNAARTRLISRIGGYSLFHFVDTSSTDQPSSTYFGDGGIENGVKIGINVKDLSNWTKGRYRSVIPMMDNNTDSLSEDAFWADELDGEIGSMIARASKDRSNLRSRVISGLARAPGLISLAQTNK